MSSGLPGAGAVRLMVQVFDDDQALGVSSEKKARVVFGVKGSEALAEVADHAGGEVDGEGLLAVGDEVLIMVEGSTDALEWRELAKRFASEEGADSGIMDERAGGAIEEA